MSRLFPTLMTAVCMAITLPVSAQESTYVSGGLGLHKPRTNEVLIGPASSEAKFKTGFVGIGAFGWKWEQDIRTEIELGYRDSSASTLGAIDASGGQDVFSAMGNVLFEPDIDSEISIYVGAGLGVASTSWSNVSTAATPVFDGSKTKLAYQGIVGMAYPIDEGLDLTLDYRYHNQTGLDFRSVAGGATAMDHDNRNHNIILGLRFALGGPKAPAPEPVVQPAPPQRPAPAPMPVSNLPETFIVFFDWDKSLITSEAMSILRDAAAFADRENAAKIIATGHADRSGTTAYNMALSERRARAVQAELIRLGIPENEISISWKGESQTLVSTDDGVREPQNRRVEIIIE